MAAQFSAQPKQASFSFLSVRMTSQNVWVNLSVLTPLPFCSKLQIEQTYFSFGLDTHWKQYVWKHSSVTGSSNILPHAGQRVNSLDILLIPCLGITPGNVQLSSTHWHDCLVILSWTDFECNVWWHVRRNNKDVVSISIIGILFMDVPNQVNYSVFSDKQRKHFICLKITKTPELVQTCLLGNSLIYILVMFLLFTIQLLI